MYHDDLLADKITGHGARPSKTSTSGYAHRDVAENLKYFMKIDDILSGDEEYQTEEWTEEEMERASVERSLGR
jgi:hypothetical protein